MSKVFLDMAMSLDGFVAGPNGEDRGLYTWYFDPSAASKAMIAELTQSIGAMIMGRRTYNIDDTHDSSNDPYQMPHFILTHNAPSRPIKDSRATFVSEGGIERALALARAAAADKDVCVAGGANTAQQFLRAGLIDEIRIHLVPVLLGEGLRLFEFLGNQDIKLKRTLVIEAIGVTHLRFQVLRSVME
jgi:dihydrofolate reductase